VSLVHNERVKLLATALSNTGVATVVTAIIAPIAGFLYGSPTAVASRWVVADRSSLVCDRLGPTYYRAGRPRKVETMTDVQLYLLVVPVVLLALGGIAYWWATTLE